jgi:hypothetical protein
MEQTMTIYEYLMKAVQDDARRAGERDRLLLEARRARRARRQRLVPAAPARRKTEIGRIVVSENVTLDGVIQDRPVTKASGPAAGRARSGRGAAAEDLPVALEGAHSTRSARQSAPGP